MLFITISIMIIINSTELFALILFLLFCFSLSSFSLSFMYANTYIYYVYGISNVRNLFLFYIFIQNKSNNY